MWVNAVRWSSGSTDIKELDKLKRTLDDYFNVKLETRDISLKGWNWGKAQVQGG